jgi:neutral trehalase
MSNSLHTQAREILNANDCGGRYTVPTASGLYPAQWNWDSCLVALGFAQYDPARAWQEIETLFAGQWPDGMVPHILFHGDDSSYFPNHTVWATQRHVPSSGITQPAVAATAVRYLVEHVQLANTRERLLALAPKLLAWHRWFYSARDKQGIGLPSIIHPWESGMDNNPIWDDALAAVPPGESVQHLRKDILHADRKVRPTGPEYDRYINLVFKFREHGYDSNELFHAAPFRVADIGFSSILQRANHDLRYLLALIGDQIGVAEVDRMIARTASGLSQRWDAAAGYFWSLNTRTGESIHKPGIGSFLPLYASTTVAQDHPELVTHLDEWLAAVPYGMPSYDPRREEFEPQRYWRGPVWLVVNWMLIDGLRQNGLHAQAERIRHDSLALVERSGFYEYYDPTTGEGLGGASFSWTAAMYLFLSTLG